MPKNFFYFIIIAIILVSALVLRITDNSGTWLCLEGEWLKQGITTQEKPSEPCIDFSKIHSYEACAQLDDFIWCSEIERCIASTLACDSFIDPINELSYIINIIEPMKGELISSPYEIRGLAPGTWYFEADFEIQLLDQERNILASTIAIAQSDWMTTELVPFIANLEFETDYQGPAQLLLIKDNPSGLEEYEDYYELEVSI